ncbi:MAG: hypothetical protein KIT09_03585 [Bryobacteraceae bacterium]|nr:hypothetical protein [Bryobacteraceae bacterium]
MALILALAQPPGVSAQPSTALDRYVSEPDASYSFRLVRSAPGAGYRVHVLEMTSQTWRTAAEVDQPAWRHWLRIVVPSRAQTSTAFLLVNGGTISEAEPSAVNVEIAPIASAVGAVAAELRIVPNQPLTFAGETAPRSEDALIAHTWDKYLRTGDERWPAQLPMTKAVVRAMDAVIAFCRSAEGGGVTVDRFVVAGGSKRGWATWLTAAVDPRVTAVIPVVIDLLNTEDAFVHHWQTYGRWAQAVGDYERAGIFTWLRTPRMGALQAIVDPYLYRDRLTMPKYIVNAAGDEFFTPDSSRFYFDGLPGAKYLRYVPNAPHDLDIADVLTGGIVFFQYVSGGRALPRFSWELPAEGGIRLRTEDRPSEVRLWQASNPNARDFRVATIGRTWTSNVVTEASPGLYEANVAAPDAGWRAYFLELTYSTGGLIPLALKFTTPIRVTPDTLPYAPPFLTVSAASYLPMTAADAFVSGFGQDLAATTEAATALPLPVELGGTSIRVTDSQGVERAAPLFFVSPAQINYLVPAGAALGVANVQVIRGGDVVMKGQALVEDAAPALFSADSSGTGLAAALAVVVRNGEQEIAALSRQTPVNLGAADDQVYLSLFGTGMRNANGLATATVGGESVGVAGPAPSSQFAGVDQVNLGPLPRSLAGRGELDIVLTVGGKTANTVTVVVE